MLFPLLEGRLAIRNPATGEPVSVHPDFRFFATQNPSTYANRHKLPGEPRMLCAARVSPV
jgi:midasin (ATPase involved in ribosome maturation)